MADSADVLVVGGGPTGLTLAAQLSAHGKRPRLIDRNLDRVRESRALAIQPRTLEVLAGLGVTDELLRLGNPNVRLVIHTGRRAVPLPMFDLGLADTPFPFLLFLSQAETERILLDHLHGLGVDLERGVELTALRPGPRSVTATLRRRDGSVEQIEATYVVGCDGARSVVRELAGIGFAGGAYPQTFVLADLDADGLEPATAHVFLSASGMLFFFPLVRPAQWRLLAMRPDGDTDEPLTLAVVQALSDAYTDSAVRLHDPIWMTTFRIHHRAATRYQAGRILLAGDAAHIHSPAGAQGMNTGIQDAVNLGWKLAHALSGAAPESLVDTYAVERAPVGRTVLRMSDRAFTVATSTNPVVRFARTHVVPTVLPLAGRIRLGRAAVFRTVAQLGIAYRDSPLSMSGPGARARRPRAGDRLPDAPVAGPARTLHRQTSAPRWHLLLCGPGWPDDPGTLIGARTHLVATHRLDRPADTTALDRLGVSDEPAAFLIRPDGHIGYRGNADPVTLRAYLDRWIRVAIPHDG